MTTAVSVDHHTVAVIGLVGTLFGIGAHRPCLEARLG